MQYCNADFEQIYKDNVYFVFSLANRTLHNSQDSLDVAQEVFTKLYTCPNACDIHNIKGWLVVTTRHTVVDYLRAFAKYSTVSLFDVYPYNDDSGTHSTEIKIMVHKLMDELYDKNYTRYVIVGLYYLRGLTTDKIAKQLDMSAAMVRNELSRARTYLKNKHSRELSDYISWVIVYLAITYLFEST